MSSVLSRALRARVAPRTSSKKSKRSRAARSVISAIRHFGLDQHAAFWLEELDAAWSLTDLRARVVRITDETADVKTFVFEPNTWWTTPRAGQFVTLDVEIDGVRTTRCYSLSSSPTDRYPAISVKRVPGGKVSNWLHDHLHVGDVVGLGMPAGDFVLESRVPEVMPQRLLFISGGSGATPVMSMLRERAELGLINDIVYVHAARTPNDILFLSELRELSIAHPGLKLVFAVESGLTFGLGDDVYQGRVDETLLADLVHDFEDRDTYLCGPAPMMDALATVWADAGVSKNLKMERFAPAARAKLPTNAPKRVNLGLVDSQRTVDVDAEGSLLEALEGAGEKPAFGCRMGICNTCICRKKSGAVVNTTTGAVSTEADEDIRLCVSRALSDVELAI